MQETRAATRRIMLIEIEEMVRPTVEIWVVTGRITMTEIGGMVRLTVEIRVATECIAKAGEGGRDQDMKARTDQIQCNVG